MRPAITLAMLTAVLLVPTEVAADWPSTSFPLAKPRPPKEGRVNEPYGGIVTDVTKDSITIQHKKADPVKFVASEILATGKVPKEPRPIPGRNRKYLVPASSMYRLTDVKVGDWITITYTHIGGVSICDHICIHKRPGARLPPLPEEAEALRRRAPNYIPYHEYWNAYWDLEDKGIPFPEKFGHMRRWPVAPMPREVKPETSH
jgi:hypothetical protein